MKKLERYRIEFEEIKSNCDINENRKSLLYGNLMTKLEKEFRIPMLKSEINKDYNFEAHELYRKISKARNL